MKIIKAVLSAVLGFFAKIAVSFNRIFNKDDVSSNPAGRGTGNEARPRRRLVDGVDADRFTRLCVIMVIGIVSVIGAVLIAASVRSGSHEIPVEDQEEPENRPSGTFTLSIGGNVMPTQDMLDCAFSDGKYNFRNGMSELSEVLAGDLTIAGLCGQVNAYGENQQIGGLDAGRNYPSALAATLSEMGVNYIFGANQHALANGYDGMCATISNLHVKSVGVIGMTDGDPSKLNTKIAKVNGINVGLAGYNCIEGPDYGKLTDEQKARIANVGKDTLTDRAATDITKLRRSGAEFIVVCVNWGGLGSFTETDFIRNAAREIAKSGADVIVGYGPCVTLSAEVIQYTLGETDRECFVFYSLGCMYGNNVYPGQSKILGLTGKLTDEQKKAIESEKKLIAKSKQIMPRSMIVNLSVARNGDGLVLVEQASYNPIYVIRNSAHGDENSHLKYLSVPCAKYVAAEVRPEIFAGDKEWENCKAAFKGICAIADKSGGRLVLRDLNSTGEVESDTSDGKI